MLHSPHMVQISSLPTTGPMEQPLQQLHPPPMSMDPTTILAPPPLPGPGIIPDGPQVLGAGNPMQPPQHQQVVVTLSGSQTLPPNQMNGGLPGMLPPPQPLLDHQPQSIHMPPPPPPPPPAAQQIQMNGSAAMPHVAHVPHMNGGCGGGPPIGQHQQHPIITSVPAPMSMSTAGPLPTMAMNGTVQHMNGGMQLQPQQGHLQQQQQVT